MGAPAQAAACHHRRSSIRPLLPGEKRGIDKLPASSGGNGTHEVVGGKRRARHRLKRAVLAHSQRRNSVIKNVAGQQFLIAGRESKRVDGAGAAAGERRTRYRRETAIGRNVESRAPVALKKLTPITLFSLGGNA